VDARHKAGHDEVIRYRSRGGISRPSFVQFPSLSNEGGRSAERRISLPFRALAGARRLPALSSRRFPSNPGRAFREASKGSLSVSELLAGGPIAAGRCPESPGAAVANRDSGRRPYPTFKAPHERAP
jgi:hypothetical protein